MSAEILKGAATARAIKQAAREELSKLSDPPRVVAVHNPESPAAGYYMRQQKKVFEEAGVRYDVRTLEPGTSESVILSLVEELSRDPKIAGITVHTPLPKGVDSGRVMQAIAPSKDIEGIHPQNLGRLAFGGHLPAPCAASAAVELAKVARPSFRGLEAVVVGRSALVGKAIAMLLLHSRTDAPTPTICHTATLDLGAVTRRADLLFAAAGRAGLVTGAMIKPGAVVIDVGISETPDGKLVGDVIFEEAKERAGVITPVPGGVGPVSTAILLRNLVGCIRLQSRS